jgi:hypothetical protein
LNADSADTGSDPLLARPNLFAHVEASDEGALRSEKGHDQSHSGESSAAIQQAEEAVRGWSIAAICEAECDLILQSLTLRFRFDESNFFIRDIGT